MRWYPGGEPLVFAVATAVGLLHGLDDAFLHRQPGVELDQHAVAALVASVLAVGGIAVFPALRPGLRSAVAASFGVMALANGVQHVIHIGLDGPARSDLTGVLAAAAGAGLVVLGVAIPFRHRGERPGRRWPRRAVAIVGGLLFVYAVLFPSALGIVQTHKYREVIGEPPGREYRDVEFAAADGLRIAGWYAPSRNGAAVILVHGGGGDRTGARDHARLLARHGYGVLLYDSRGRGESEGSPNAFGWGWEEDVAGALAFLRSREDVEGGRIGALGLSTGADVLIEVAVERRELRAVVADGATGRSTEDVPPGTGISDRPFLWSMFTATRILSGSSPGDPLEELVARVSPTPLLLIGTDGIANELEFNQQYARAAREPFDFWELRGVGHTAAVRERRAEYERRVVGFLDRALRAP